MQNHHRHRLQLMYFEAAPRLCTAMPGRRAEVAVVCIVCGSYATCKPVHLLLECTGPAAKDTHGHAVLERVRRGEHPAEPSMRRMQESATAATVVPRPWQFDRAGCSREQGIEASISPSLSFGETPASFVPEDERLLSNSSWTHKRRPHLTAAFRGRLLAAAGIHQDRAGTPGSTQQSVACHPFSCSGGLGHRNRDRGDASLRGGPGGHSVTEVSCSSQAGGHCGSSSSSGQPAAATEEEEAAARAELLELEACGLRVRMT